MSEFELLQKGHKAYNMHYKTSRRTTEYKKYRVGSGLLYPLLILKVGKNFGHFYEGDIYFSAATIYSQLSLHAGIFNKNVETLCQLGYVERIPLPESRQLAWKFKMDYRGYKFYKITRKGYNRFSMFEVIFQDFNDTKLFKEIEDNDTTVD